MKQALRLTSSLFYFLVALSALLLASVDLAYGKKVTGTISANPWTDVIIPEGQTFGSTTVTYSAKGISHTQVYVSVNGKENPCFFSQGNSGTAIAPWIQDGATYDFNLYEGTNRSKLLATVSVIGRKFTYDIGVDYHATGADFFRVPSSPITICPLCGAR